MLWVSRDPQYFMDEETCAVALGLPEPIVFLYAFFLCVKAYNFQSVHSRGSKDKVIRFCASSKISGVTGQKLWVWVLLTHNLCQR